MAHNRPRLLRSLPLYPKQLHLLSRHPHPVVRPARPRQQHQPDRHHLHGRRDHRADARRRRGRYLGPQTGVCTGAEHVFCCELRYCVGARV